MSYYVNSAGVRFYYQDHGPADASAVLLVSPWALNSTSWEYQVPALVAAGYRCVAMDRRGHGRSDEPGTGYELDTLADDLADLIRFLGLDECAVVAHSMGCAETARMLSRHPDIHVTRALFMGTITPWLVGAVGEEAYEIAVQELRADRCEWFASRIDAYLARPGSGVSQALADEIVSVGLAVPLEVLVSCQWAFGGTDVSADLAALDIPVLVVHGGADVSAPIELTAERTMPLLRNGKLLVYPGAPHGLHVSHKEQFNKDLLRFLI